MKAYQDRKELLEKRIKSNENYLSANVLSLNKHSRREISFNIYKDKEELKLIIASLKDN